MSKKDKKAKDKHSSNGSKKHDKSEGIPMTLIPQMVSLVPPEDQFPVNKKTYEKELARLQEELIKLQEWIRHKNLKVVVIFEGRDAAGKGGVIKRITESLNPRVCRVVALPAPTEREKNSVVLPALCGPSARRRRDGTVRPQLVQPCQCRKGDGILHR